jgi:hypothetical protein
MKRLLIAGTVLAVLLSACGGGGSTLIDPAHADPLAHQVLLANGDLPGSGWTVTKSDQFDDGGSKTDTAACKDIDGQRQAANSKSDAGRAGRAEQELSLRGKSPIPVTVEATLVKA